MSSTLWGVSTWVRVATGWRPRQDALWWIISPEQHAVEGTLYTLASILVTVVAYKRVSAAAKSWQNLAPSWWQHEHASKWGRRLDALFAAWLLCLFVVQVQYKIRRDPVSLSHLWWLLMPCYPVTLLLAAALSGVCSARQSDYLYNAAMIVMWAPTMAIAFPDPSHYTYDLELAVFWCHHLSLLVVPVYAALCGRYRTAPLPWPWTSASLWRQWWWFNVFVTAIGTVIAYAVCGTCGEARTGAARLHLRTHPCCV